MAAIAARLRQIPWRSFASEGIDRILLVTKVACFSHAVNTHLVSFALPVGPSMIPAFNLTGDIVLMDRVAPRWGNIKVGDVVFLRSPENPMKIVAKRVLGLEGDSVSYLVDPAIGTKSKTVVVPEGHIWVQGDNIYDSNDSRQFGPAPYGLIYGRGFWRVWPPNDFGAIPAN